MDLVNTGLANGVETVTKIPKQVVNRMDCRPSDSPDPAFSFQRAKLCAELQKYIWKRGFIMKKAGNDVVNFWGLRYRKDRV